MAFYNEKPRINGYHVLEIPVDSDPYQAIADATVLLEYAAMHTGMFSRRHLQALEHAKRFAERVLEELD